MAFDELVQSQTGFPPHELPEIFAAPDADGEHNAARDLIRLDAEHLTRMFALERLAAFARPLGGGEVTTIAASCWELDNPLPRFATGAINLEEWADPNASPTHRIFVDNAQFVDWLAVNKGGERPHRENPVLDPSVREGVQVPKAA